MIRFAFTFTLFLLVVGCQTAAPGPKSKPSVIVHAPQATPAKTFWSRTAKLFQPLMPDTGKRNAESESRFALNHSRSDILPVNHTPNSLYKAGSIFPSPLLTSPPEESHVLIAETVTKPNSPQPSTSDSATSKSLSQDTSAPLPDEELVAERKPTETARNVVKKRDIEPGYDFDDEEFDEEPIVRKSVKKPLQRREESVVAQTSVPVTTPVYPSLTQLPSTAPAVVQASYQQSLPPYANNVSGYGAGDWQAPTRMAIEQLRYAIEQTPNGRSLSNEMRLRMLEMLLGNKVEAAKAMQSADKTINNFMGHQVLGFAALLDDSMTDNRGKYISAAYRFNEGLSELQKLCPIKLKNVMFVKDWFGYGQFIAHTGEFCPGEAFCVYIEIENPVVRPANGFEVSVAISYEIRDIHANVVVQQDAGKPAERTLSRKRDYCLTIPGTLPTSLAPGQYQLRINVTDLNDDSMQYAEEQIPLKVVPSLASESDGKFQDSENRNRHSRESGNDARSSPTRNDIPY